MSLRYLFRLLEAFFKRFKAIIVIGILIGMALFLILNLVLPDLNRTYNVIGTVGRYTTDNIPEDIALKISKGLTSVDSSGNVTPAIAKSWESLDNGKTWVFHLDENKTWQDGKKIMATDITYKFSDADLEVVDDKTIKFNLNSQFSAFPVIVSKPIFKKGLVGVGDWRVKKVSLSAGFLQKLVISDINKNIIVFKFYPTEERLRLGFKLGEVDEINKIYDPSPFDKWKTVSINKSIDYNNFVGIFLNTENERLSDKSTRQSLAYAIDKASYNNDVDNDRAIGPISPNSWAFNPQVKQYQRDIEKTKDIKDMTITLSTFSNLLKYAEKIKQDWESVGVLVDIQVVSNIPSDYQAFLATVDIPKDPDQYGLWHSTQTDTNISHFKNVRIDKLLEDGRTELNMETRKKIYLDFQRFLVEEVPAIFLYHPTLYSITRK